MRESKGVQLCFIDLGSRRHTCSEKCEATLDITEFA